MEIFREIEQRFADIKVFQDDTIAGMRDLTAGMRELAAGLQNLATRVEVLTDPQTRIQEEVQGLRGAFASIEAMMIMNAAQMASYNKELADVKSRLDALERKAS